MDAFNFALAAFLFGMASAAGQVTNNNTEDLFPKIFEVDLLFPRNETYSPDALMPIVFAMHSPSIAVDLQATVSWNLWEGNSTSAPGSINGGLIDSDWILEGPLPDGPFIFTRFVNTFDYPDGFWVFQWSLEVETCSEVGDMKTMQQSNSITFTTSKSGPAPDLVAATNPDICGTAEAYAYNVTYVEPSCGGFGPSPTTNPCAATINASVAASISHMGLVGACSPLETGVYHNVTCPPGILLPSGSAAGTVVPSHLAMLSALLTLPAMLGSLLYFA